MDKMISINHATINHQVGNLQNEGIIYCWKTYKFRSIKISGNRNQCLQYYITTFYHHVDDLKKTTILWLVVHWGQYAVYRTNDNAFIVNRMLDYNTALYDDIDDKWQFDRVNDLSVMCCIEYSKKSLHLYVAISKS